MPYLLSMQGLTLEQAIRESWDRNTCYPPLSHLWTPQNPSVGQGAVTALVIQDYLGGSLPYCKHLNHYWNLTRWNEDIDLTRAQFPPDAIICMDDLHSREYVIARIDANTMERYQILKERVEQKMSAQMPNIYV